MGFVLKTKKAIKTVAAISSGALMMGLSIAGAAATDLSDYPSPFIQNGQWTGVLVVGADAQPADVIGATNIAAALAQQTSVTPTAAVVTGGKEKELDLGDGLNDSTNGFSNILDDDDLAGFQDTKINIDISNTENDYDVHDELKVGGLSGGVASIESGLTYTANQDEDFKEDAFMAVPRNSIGYYYKFDDTLKAGNYINDSTTSDPVTIDFLGKSLEIISADNDTITVQVGEEHFMNVDDTVTVQGHTVKLINVGSGTSPASVVVSVDGVQETVSGTEKVNGIRIKVKETFYSDTKAERSATLVIGEDATKSYDDGDAYIGQDEDDPDWVWDLAGLQTNSPTIGILWDQTYDDPGEVIGVGSSLALPNNYATIELEGYTVTDTKEYTIEAVSGETLYNSTGSEIVTSAKAIHFHADGGGEDGFKVDTDETDDVYLYFNSTNNDTEVFWKDHDDANKIKKSTKAYLNGSTTADQFSITYKDTTITVDGTSDSTGHNLNLTIDEGTTDLKLYLTTSNDVFDYIGHSDGDTTTANDVLYGTKDISGWEENTRTQKGLIVHSYDKSASSDKLIFDVPSDISDFAVKVLISGPGTTVTGGGAASTLGGVAIAKLDTEVSDPTAQPVIAVGGPAVNRITAQALGLTYPTYGADAGTALGISSGQATLKLIDNAFGGTNVALIVAGWEADDTRNAASVLQDFSAYSAQLTGDQVIVTSAAGVITVSQPTVAAPAEETTNETSA